MDQAIFIDDDDVVMIGDDTDEVVLLEQAPSISPTPFLTNAAFKNRASQSVPKGSHHQVSMLRSRSDGSADPNYSTRLPPIDLTTDVASRHPISQDCADPEDSARRVSSIHVKSIPRDEGYKSLHHWNIGPGASTSQEAPRGPVDFSRLSNDRALYITAHDELAAKPQIMPRASMHGRRYSNESLLSISVEEDGGESTFAQDVPLRRDDNVILIEDNDDFEFKLEAELLEKPEFEFLRSVSVTDKPNTQRNPRVVHSLRNPPIISPYFECGRYLHGKLDLRPMKTVELDDGDFVYIKHVVKYVKPEDKFDFSLENAQDPPITIRGLRLQRCKYLNGMLEKKMNEVCLCYEIDLDDQREPEEQSLVEVSLSSVKALRSLRWTNHKYPRYRNLDRDAIDDYKDAYNTGGLTVRWKYTCTYASASAREQNIYAERTLERITEDWLSSVHRTSHTYLTSNSRLRTEWRGETIPGGTYLPEYYEIEEDDDPMAEVQQPKDSTMIEDTQSRRKSFVVVDDDDDVDDDDGGTSPPLSYQQFGMDGMQIKRKSDFSFSSDLNCFQEDDQPAKRVRQDSDDNIEMIRQRLGQVMLSFNGEDYVKYSYNIGTPGTDSGSTTGDNEASPGHVHSPGSSSRSIWSNRDVPSKVRGRSTSPRSGSPGSQISYSETSLSHAPSSTPSPDIPPQIDINSSELASPPPNGVIDLSPSPSPHHSRSSSLATYNGSTSPSIKKPRTLAPGQTYTYGDAFCGAGGTTRGAVMAGLRVKWGFDFNHHACTTWRLNFPHATCYEMSSERFVALATPSPYSSYTPDDVKVDILHLSPPCQYFSPAHTIEGKNDEMNTASLFAVAAVIKVAKPRVVTLEQTFGILYPKFRGYFSSLICMFTSCGFSLRWAIVPLAQWGLPQRRFRLIIIASCPGEPLPPMPPPTHSSPSSPLPNTHLFKTVHQTLREISASAANHAPHLLPEKDLKPYDPHSILPRTMTTSGGDNWHPSGKRGFTDREFASLQGFPLQHRFGLTGIKRQIGNAVPPVVAKVLFEGIRKFMEGMDGIVKDVGGEDGSLEVEDGATGDAMDICEDLEGVQVVREDHEVEIVDLVGETDERGEEEEEVVMGMDEESDDDEVEIVRAVHVLRHSIID
ncbi:hypothetical protein SBOR_1118 [Sclerotinia borealis F-4128]|uniref:DNA (cytosine-5-)-methyltransferase n=1 Tax=Sclerotinia borealis (strain F-4128) TaxID=1432307 RepID=W9CRH7_SCLBF|nr:hypothetical protein SBOR_1118 [Sclerotinia borealis F-4128]